MIRFLLGAALSVVGWEASAMVCRGPALVLRITLEEDLCRIGGDVAIRRDVEGATECRLSNPQLRIITLHSDGRFSYLDTDTDLKRDGVCTAE